MNKLLTHLAMAVFLLMTVSINALAAQTEKLVGRIYADSVKSQMPLGNGDAPCRSRAIVVRPSARVRSLFAPVARVRSLFAPRGQQHASPGQRPGNRNTIT